MARVVDAISYDMSNLLPVIVIMLQLCYFNTVSTSLLQWIVFIFNHYCKCIYKYIFVLHVTLYMISFFSLLLQN